jgi:hypothetical protein
MTELSPQAQAVWDAYERVDCDPYEIDPRKAGLSAALETVADQVVPVELHPQAYEDCCQYSDVQTRAGIRANLLAIAAELRGTSTTTETP